MSIPHGPLPGEPAGIAGLESFQLKAAFGTPSFVRDEGGYQLWRYDGQACKAFFFLYRDGASLAVRHVETMPRGGAMAADTACLDAIRGHRAPVTS